jgi:hypothetical protein
VDETEEKGALLGRGEMLEGAEMGFDEEAVDAV